MNRTQTGQHNAGLSGQVTHFGAGAARRNQLTAGAAFDRSRAAFTQSSQLGYLNPDRSITGVDAFGDGVTGGTVDGEPYDTRVDLDGLTTTWSVYATDTLSFGDRAHVTAVGPLQPHDASRTATASGPAGEAGSLDGSHLFSRFNPAAGVTVNASRAINLYAGYNEGSRAATSIELGCADPEQPCKLPNAMAGDPPLAQVVTRTLDAGVRGQSGRLAWNAGYFRAANRDDILFVQSEQTGFGYFKNFGRTRREGLELGARARAGVAELGAGYTLLDATFRSSEEVNGESNSTNDAAAAGGPGLEGSIEIEPGDRMPLIPRHMLKLYADIQVTRALSIDADLVAFSGTVARGNENGDHEADGTYYRRAGRHGRVRRRQSGRALCSDVVAHTRWPGQQPVRPPLHDGGAPRPDGLHPRGCVPLAPVPAGWRRVPAHAQHAVRAGRTGARLVRHAVPLLARAAVRCGCR